jgi:hypothetical protein
LGIGALRLNAMAPIWPARMIGVFRTPLVWRAPGALGRGCGEAAAKKLNVVRRLAAVARATHRFGCVAALKAPHCLPI